MSDETMYHRPVTPELFDRVAADLLRDAEQVWHKKCNSYSLGHAGGSALANFEELARLCDVTPQTVALIYAAKHFFSIVSAVRRGDSGGEELYGRYIDLINYLKVLAALDEAGTRPGWVPAEASTDA